jgi:hypothetical protein
MSSRRLNRAVSSTFQRANAPLAWAPEILRPPILLRLDGQHQLDEFERGNARTRHLMPTGKGRHTAANRVRSPRFNLITGDRF